MEDSHEEVLDQIHLSPDLPESLEKAKELDRQVLNDDLKTDDLQENVILKSIDDLLTEDKEMLKYRRNAKLLLQYVEKIDILLFLSSLKEQVISSSAKSLSSNVTIFSRNRTYPLHKISIHL